MYRHLTDDELERLLYVEPDNANALAEKQRREDGRP